MEDEREEEITAIEAIYPELVIDPSDTFTARLDVLVHPNEPLHVQFLGLPHNAVQVGAVPSGVFDDSVQLPTYSQAMTVRDGADTERQLYKIEFLPSIHVRLSLPINYPATEPPHVQLSTHPPWVPRDVLDNLESSISRLWEDCGRGQVLFAYIDYIQQEAERAFDLCNSIKGVLELPQALQIDIMDHDMRMKRKAFEQETFDCGVCLEPKKGAVCYRLSRCGHVFCKACLQDFYNNCITEGDVAGVKCVDPSCGTAPGGNIRKRKPSKLNANELLQIPLEPEMVKRFVEMKRKKRLESDKSTIYCPRQWCQGPARSKRHPRVDDPFGADPEDSESEVEEAVPKTDNISQASNTVERLAICEKCNFAFCRVCLASWHGDFLYCKPKGEQELSAEEKASNDYIRAFTSPCPTCAVPSQKMHGCNHMTCSQCRTHFCYLCCAWLSPANPYQHFNTKGTPCFQRLWDLERGEDPENLNFDERDVMFPGRADEVAMMARERAQAEQAAAARAAEQQAQRDDPVRIEALQRAAANLNIVVGPAAPAVRARHVAADPPLIGQRLQRFLQMVQNDEEDEWDSDELDDEENDRRWDIPVN